MKMEEFERKSSLKLKLAALAAAAISSFACIAQEDASAADDQQNAGECLVFRLQKEAIEFFKKNGVSAAPAGAVSRRGLGRKNSRTWSNDFDGNDSSQGDGDGNVVRVNTEQFSGSSYTRGNVNNRYVSWGGSYNTIGTVLALPCSEFVKAQDFKLKIGKYEFPGLVVVVPVEVNCTSSVEGLSDIAKKRAVKNIVESGYTYKDGNQRTVRLPGVKRALNRKYKFGRVAEPLYFDGYVAFVMFNYEAGKDNDKVRIAPWS